MICVTMKMYEIKIKKKCNPALSIIELPITQCQLRAIEL